MPAVPLRPFRILGELMEAAWMEAASVKIMSYKGEKDCCYGRLQW